MFHNKSISDKSVSSNSNSLIDIKQMNKLADASSVNPLSKKNSEKNNAEESEKENAKSNESANHIKLKVSAFIFYFTFPTISRFTI